MPKKRKISIKREKIWNAEVGKPTNIILSTLQNIRTPASGSGSSGEMAEREAKLPVFTDSRTDGLKSTLARLRPHTAHDTAPTSASAPIRYEDSSRIYMEPCLNTLNSLRDEQLSLDQEKALHIFIKMWGEANNPATSARMEEAATEPAQSGFFGKLSACASAVKRAIYDPQGYVSRALNYKVFKTDITVGNIAVVTLSGLFATGYAMVSQYKAELSLGDETASGFSAFSWFSNFAQMFITLNNGLGENFSRLKAFMRGSLTLTALWTVYSLSASLLPGTPLAASAFDATLKITESHTLAKFSEYYMWFFRSFLTFRSSLILPVLLCDKADNIAEKWRQMAEGDKTAAQTLLETSLLAGALAVALKYSLDQMGVISEFSLPNLFHTSVEGHAHLAKFTEIAGVIPLAALNINFIVTGTEKLTEMWGKPHGLLFLAFALAAPTGFPGIALISSKELMDMVNAYFSAVTSNYASIAGMPWLKEKIDRDHLVDLLNSLTTRINLKKEEIKNASTSHRPEQEEQVKNLGLLADITLQMSEHYRSLKGTLGTVSSCLAKGDRAVAEGLTNLTSCSFFSRARGDAYEPLEEAHLRTPLLGITVGE